MKKLNKSVFEKKNGYTWFWLVPTDLIYFENSLVCKMVYNYCTVIHDLFCVKLLLDNYPNYTSITVYLGITFLPVV